MDIRKLVFLGVAIFLAGAIALSIRSAAKPNDAGETKVAKELPSVLVAKVDLPAGSFVTPDQLAWQVWPSDSIVPTYLKKNEHKAEDFSGSVVRSGLVAGEPITEAKLIKPNDRGFMSSVLNPGSRAVSVQVNETTGISGFVFPGDRVDVILTQSLSVPGEEGGKPRKASETILTNIRVLAVDQRTDNQKPEAKVAKTATLEVTPKQAEMLALMSDLGRITLSLRSLASDQETVVAGPSFTWDAETSILLSPGLKPLVTSVVRGGASEEVVVGRGGS